MRARADDRIGHYSAVRRERRAVPAGGEIRPPLVSAGRACFIDATRDLLARLVDRGARGAELGARNGTARQAARVASPRAHPSRRGFVLLNAVALVIGVSALQTLRRCARRASFDGRAGRGTASGKAGAAHRRVRDGIRKDRSAPCGADEHSVARHERTFPIFAFRPKIAGISDNRFRDRAGIPAASHWLRRTVGRAVVCGGIRRDCTLLRRRVSCGAPRFDARCGRRDVAAA
jgi:hypothetical protein